MPSAALRPRSATELLDAAFQLYRAHVAPLALLSAIALVPVAAASVLFTAAIGPAGEPPALDDVGVWLLILPLTFAWYAIGEAALVAAASEAYLGGTPSVATALRSALGRAGTILLATIGKYLAIFFFPSLAAGLAGGILAAINPLLALPVMIGAAAWGVHRFGRYVPIPATVVLEPENSAARALRRSRTLAEGNVGRLLGAMLVAYLILFVLQLTVSFGLGVALNDPRAVQFVGQLAWIAVYPIIGTLMTLLYYDLRIRKEGFDLEVMARELEGDAATAPV